MEMVGRADYCPGLKVWVQIPGKLSVPFFGTHSYLKKKPTFCPHTVIFLKIIFIYVFGNEENFSFEMVILNLRWTFCFFWQRVLNGNQKLIHVNIKKKFRWGLFSEIWKLLHRLLKTCYWQVNTLYMCHVPS